MHKVQIVNAIKGFGNSGWALDSCTSMMIYLCKT